MGNNHQGKVKERLPEESPYPTNSVKATNSEHFENVYFGPARSSDFKAVDLIVLNSLVESYRDCFVGYMKKLDMKLKALPLNCCVDVDSSKVISSTFVPNDFTKGRIVGNFQFTEKGIYKVFNALIMRGRLHSDNHLMIILTKSISKNDLIPFVEEKFGKIEEDIMNLLWSSLSSDDADTKSFSFIITIDDTSNTGKGSPFISALLRPFAPSSVTSHNSTVVRMDKDEDFIRTGFEVQFLN